MKWRTIERPESDNMRTGLPNGSPVTAPNLKKMASTKALCPTPSGSQKAAELEAAVDYLENHEEVVRWPLALTSPPQFLLKPGRIWPETRDKLLKAQSGSAS